MLDQKDSHGYVNQQWIITNHHRPEIEDLSILPIIGVPITMLYCVLPISEVVFMNV